MLCPLPNSSVSWLAGSFDHDIVALVYRNLFDVTFRLNVYVPCQLKMHLCSSNHVRLFAVCSKSILSTIIHLVLLPTLLRHWTDVLYLYRTYLFLCTSISHHHHRGYTIKWNSYVVFHTTVVVKKLTFRLLAQQDVSPNVFKTTIFRLRCRSRRCDLFIVPTKLPTLPFSLYRTYFFFDLYPFAHQCSCVALLVLSAHHAIYRDWICFCNQCFCSPLSTVGNSSSTFLCSVSHVGYTNTCGIANLLLLVLCDGFSAMFDLLPFSTH